MEISTPEWHDVYTPEELAVACEHHAAIVAKRLGAYAIADELRYAAACIRDLEDQRDALRSAGGDMVRQVMAAKESLTRL